MASPWGKRQSTPALLAIALFKLLKGVALIAVGIGALKLLRHDVSETIGHWIDVLRVDPDNRLYPRSNRPRSSTSRPKQLEATSAGTFFYAALLFDRRHWVNVAPSIGPSTSQSSPLQALFRLKSTKSPDTSAPRKP